MFRCMLYNNNNNNNNNNNLYLCLKLMKNFTKVVLVIYFVLSIFCLLIRLLLFKEIMTKILLFIINFKFSVKIFILKVSKVK